MARGLEPAGVTFVAEGIDGFVRDLGKADKAQDNLVKSTKELDWTYKDASGRLRDLSGKFVTTGDSAEKTGKQTKKAGEQAERAGPSFSMLGSIVTGVATAMTTMAIQAVAKLSQALVGLAQDSIGVATEFESSMAVLGIAASSTGLGMEDLSEAALAVGGDTRLLGVSASGAAESMTGLFKAGLTSQEVFGDLQGYMDGTAELGGTLRASIDLAAASSLDMVAASDLAAITLATFGHEAEVAGISTDEWIVQAMDNLVRTADASVAEVEGLQAAMQNVGPTAAAFGFSMTDVNTSLAILSTRGIQGSEAGTALKSMFTNMMRQTPKVTGALEELGVVLYDNNGVMLSIPEIMGQFEVAMEGLTDQQKNQYIQTIAGTYGMKTMQTLLGEGIQGWNDMEVAIGGAATMMEQGEARSQTLAAQQEALDGVMETLKIRIGSALLPALTGMTTIFADLVDKYGPLVSEAFERIGAILGDLVNWFVIFLEEGDYLNDFLANLPGPIQSVIKIVGDLIGRFESLTKVFERGGLEAVFTIWQDGSSAMGYFLEGLGLSEEAAIGISNVIGSVVDTIDRIRQWFVENGPAIRSALDQIGQVFGMVFESIKEVVEDIWPIFEEIGATFGETFEVIKEVLGEFGLNFDDTGSGIETVTGMIIGVIELMGGIIAGVLTAIAGTVKFFAEHFQDVWMGIRDVIQGVKEWFEGFKQFWTSLFEGDLPGALEGLEKGFSGFAKFIKGMMKVIVKTITMPFKRLYKLIEGFVKGVIKFFENLKKKLVGGSIIPDMMDKIEKVIDTVLGIILKVWEKVFEKILDVTQEIFASIERTVDRVMSAVEKIIDTITTAIGGDWEDFVDLLHELWEDTWDDIHDAVDTIFSAVEDLIDRIAGSIEDLWDSFTETLEEVWENAWDAIQSTVDSILNAIESLIDNITSTIESNWSTFTDTLEQVWSTAWDTIQSTVDTILSAIESLIDSISGSITSAWESFTTSLQSTWETIWGAIQSFVDTTFNAIMGLISSISGSIESAWGTFTGAIQTAWETTWNAIESFVNTVFGNVQTAISTISGAIETAWDTWLGGLQYMFETMFNALEGIVNTAMGLVEGAVETALSALADILAIGSNLYNGIMTIGHNIANAVRDGVVALWNVITGAITTALEALGAVGTFGMAVWSRVSELGKKIVNMIKSGLTYLWDAAGGLVAALKSKLEGLIDAIGTSWEKVKEIGGRILGKIMDGVKANTQWAADFWNWLWGHITNWLRWHSGEEVGDMMGDKITDGLVDSIRSQTGVRLLDALDYATDKALRDVGFQVPVQLSAAMQGGVEADMMRAAAGFSASLGMVAPAMMAPMTVSNSTEVNIGPVAISNGMDMAEFEVRVRQAVSEAI